jgi:hypothetical protein
MASAHCQVNENIEAGVMSQMEVPLYFENFEIKAILPYLVGGATYPLGVHMMVIDPPPGSAEAGYDARILLARCVNERCFGRQAGRRRASEYRKMLLACRSLPAACQLLHGSNGVGIRSCEGVCCWPLEQPTRHSSWVLPCIRGYMILRPQDEKCAPVRTSVRTFKVLSTSTQ